MIITVWKTFLRWTSLIFCHLFNKSRDFELEDVEVVVIALQEKLNLCMLLSVSRLRQIELGHVRFLGQKIEDGLKCIGN